MEEIFMKIILISCLVTICVQDLRERKAYGFLFGISICCLFGLQMQQNTLQQVVYCGLLNSSLLLAMGFFALLFTKFILGKAVKKCIGLGDVLLFVGYALGFPTLSFVILFAFSLLFSLCVHQILHSNPQKISVPLAGLQALFLALVLLFDTWITYATLYRL